MFTTLTQHQIWCKSVNGGLVGKWVNYNKFYIRFFYLGTHLQVRPIIRFAHLMAQITRTRARMCFWYSLVDISTNLGGQITPKPQFWGHE